MAYVGQTRSRTLIARLERVGIGECVVRGELPPRRPDRFFHDNGAYRDWRAGRAFNITRWTRDMRWMNYRGLVPDFVVVPDIVAGGRASLDFSHAWRVEVPEHFAAYLAVQDGMTREDVATQLDRYDGLFVGGTLAWKLATAGMWVELAHARGKRCHVGRVGTPARVRWARMLGVNSIDSCLPLRHAEHLDAFLAALAEPVEPTTQAPSTVNARAA
jgi:hypothetical protein